MSSLVFGWEPVRTIFAAPNWQDLIREHWEELAVHKDRMALDPDYGRVALLEDNGLFRAWTARADDLLAGYLAFFVQPHLHYRTTLTAVEDLFLVSAPYRRGLNGYRMFATALEALRSLGVKRVILHDKAHWSAERRALGQPAMDVLFQRLGFEMTDRLWSRML